MIRHVFLSALLLTAMIQPAAAAPAKPGKPLSEAAALYHNYCSVCHGDKGDGNSRAKGSMFPAPRDLTTPQAAVELTRARMIHSVAEGRPGTAMAPWKSQLTPAQIEGVVDYIRTTFMKPVATIDASRGRKLYAETCSVCHGDSGNGASWAKASLNPPPKDFTSADFHQRMTREQMIFAVTNGRPGTAMAPYGSQLSKDDIATVVDYIRTAFMRVNEDLSQISGTHAHGLPPGQTAPATTTPAEPAQPAPSHPTLGPKPGETPKAYFGKPMPGGLKGSAQKGLVLFNQNCATCHGAEGNGRGPRAYFIFPKPRDFTHVGSRAVFNRPTIYDAVAKGRLGTEMPAWDKVLTPQQVADVSEYLFQQFIVPGQPAAR